MLWTTEHFASLWCKHSDFRLLDITDVNVKITELIDPLALLALPSAEPHHATATADMINKIVNQKKTPY